MKVVAIIQARMGSTRLPGKVLKTVAGKPMLSFVVNRARGARKIDQVVVATTVEPEDDAVADLCQATGVAVFRGSEDDVLDRYYKAARRFKADAVVRLTADCPLHDPTVIDEVVTVFLSGEHDYVSNTAPPTFPDGLDTEVFSLAALEQAWREAKLKSDREHVTPYLRREGLFRTANVTDERDLSSLRLTVDSAKDFKLFTTIVGHLGCDATYGLEEVLTFLEERPGLLEVNANFERNEGYRKSLEAEPDEMGASMNVREGQALYRRAKKRIPGGTQLLSKRPEMLLPEGWPCYFSKARGVDVWDLDGNHYVDMSMNGVGSCVLGAADHDVDAAVHEAVRSGVMSLLNAPEEVRLADLLCELHPWADMVRYTRSGGEALAMAVGICRAHTGRDKVAFCGYHGWHDWYLSANLARDSALDGHLLPGLAAKGVPRGLKGTALPFRYNRIDDLEAIIAEQGDELGTIVMEPRRSFLPEPGFLEQVRSLADQHQLVLVFDEVTAAFRMNPGGLHLTMGVTPDVAVFAKAMSNGYPMGAVIGKEVVMQAAQETFISSTYWTDRVGPVAAIATIEKFRAENVHEHLNAIGDAVQSGWRKAADEAGLELEVSGMAPLAHFAFKGEEAQAARSLFTALMLERGFLATNSFYATYAHRRAHVERYLDALSEVFAEVAAAKENCELAKRLPGPAAHDGFKRLA